MIYLKLKENINYSLSLGVNSQFLSEDIVKLSLQEREVKLKHKDMAKSRAMNRPSVKNKLKNAAEKPTNQRKMKMGFQKWLKIGGKKELEKTASRRFENSAVKALIEYFPSIELEDIILTISEELIKYENIVSKFEDINLSLNDRLETIKFLYENFHDRFIEVYIAEMIDSGVIVDPDQFALEDTLSTDVARVEEPYNRPSTWWPPVMYAFGKKQKDMFRHLPLIMKDLRYLMSELAEEEEDEETKNEFLDMSIELEQAVKEVEFNERIRNEVMDLLEYIFNIIENLPKESEINEELIKMAGKIEYKRKYEDAIINLVKSGSNITKEQLNIFKKKLKTEDFICVEAEDSRERVMIDFDGVIHQYVTSFKSPDIIPDLPVKGAKEAIAKLKEEYEVIVFTTRALEDSGESDGNIDAVFNWLEDNNIEVDGVTGRKLPAKIYIDDKAHRFDGDWNKVLAAVEKNKSWNK